MTLEPDLARRPHVGRGSEARQGDPGDGTVRQQGPHDVQAAAVGEAEVAHHDVEGPRSACSSAARTESGDDHPVAAAGQAQLACASALSAWSSTSSTVVSRVAWSTGAADVPRDRQARCTVGSSTSKVAPVPGPPLCGADPSSVLLDQSLRDREPQPEADAVDTVDLLEGNEYPLERCLAESRRPYR